MILQYCADNEAGKRSWPKKKKKKKKKQSNKGKILRKALKRKPVVMLDKRKDGERKWMNACY
jgi:hypothetical protein